MYQDYGYLRIEKLSDVICFCNNRLGTGHVKKRAFENAVTKGREETG